MVRSNLVAAGLLALALPAAAQIPIPPVVTYANRPTSGAARIVIISDCLTVACSAGGGSIAVLHLWDGSSLAKIAESVPGATNGVPAWNASGQIGAEANGLTWNITTATCTGDANGGALTVAGTEIVCSADDGGGVGSDTNAVKEFYWTAAGLLALEHTADSIAPIVKEEGTNVDLLVRAFDDTTDECVGGTLLVPSDVLAGSTITLRLRYYAATAAATDACWDFKHKGIDGSANESWDQALTVEASGECTADVNQDEVTECSWTETLANLGWAASDLVVFELCRDADSSGAGCTSDNLSGDAYLIDFSVEVPRG